MLSAIDKGNLGAMISGFMISRVISVATELRLADLLGAGTMSGEALAKATETHPPSLARLLRALAAWGLLEEREAGRFNLTPLGALLRTDTLGSLRSLTLLLGSGSGWRAWGELLHTIRTGETAFEHVFGRDAFQHLALDPERAAIFDAYMADLTRAAIRAILAAHDFSRYRRIVDVGGGNGALLSSILVAVPKAHGIVLDTPAGSASAPRRLEETGVTLRCRIEAGDFFADVPNGADAYVLKSVLHDWDDDRAIAILENCRRAMRSDSTLLVIERLLPERTECSDVHREIVMMDMQMLVMQSGRERTSARYAELLAAAGLIVVETSQTASPFAIIEAARGDGHAPRWARQKEERS